MAKDDKKIYKDMVEKMVQPISTSTMLGLLAKAIANGGDKKLLELIKPAHTELMKVGLSKSGSEKFDFRQLPSVKPIWNYCVAIVKSEKPAWQTLAEREGWGPLPKK